MEVRWSARAKNQFFRVGRLYAGRDPGFEGRAQRQILATVGQIIRYPQVGTAFKGIRRRRVGGAPFYVFFRLIEGRIENVHVLHLRSDWQSML